MFTQVKRNIIIEGICSPELKYLAWNMALTVHLLTVAKIIHCTTLFHTDWFVCFLFFFYLCTSVILIDMCQGMGFISYVIPIKFGHAISISQISISWIQTHNYTREANQNFQTWELLNHWRLLKLGQKLQNFVEPNSSNENSPGIEKQEESARERALCQLTECFWFVMVIMRGKHNYQGKGCTEIQ